MVDKEYCMSSYLAFRYIEADDKEFFPGLHHSNIAVRLEGQTCSVRTADDINKVFADQFAVFCSLAVWTRRSWRLICAAVMPIPSAF